jgi:hypothetical protein
MGHVAGPLSRHLVARASPCDDQVGVALSRVLRDHSGKISVRREDRQFCSHARTSEGVDLCPHGRFHFRTCIQRLGFSIIAVAMRDMGDDDAGTSGARQGPG